MANTYLEILLMGTGMTMDYGFMYGIHFFNRKDGESDDEFRKRILEKTGKDKHE